MKKAIITILVLVVLIGGFFFLKTLRAPISVLQGETRPATRGDLIVPITASGHIRPASVTNIKSEASGDVVELPHDIGEVVRKNDLIVRLDKTDEERNVHRAKADLARTRIAWEAAGLRAKQAREVGIPLAEARRDQLKAQYDLADIDHNSKLSIQRRNPSGVTPIELAASKAQLEQAKAAWDAAEVEIEQAKIAADMADKDTAAAEESKNVAERVYEEANERLAETEVVSPVDGMIVERQVQIGEVVQSGTTSLTGGTVLLQVADVNQIFAEVNVDEADIGLVRQLAPDSALPGASSRPATLPEGVLDTGQRVEVTVEAYPDEKFEGVIERISPQSEVIRAIATFKVWIRMTSDNTELLKRVLNTQAQAQFTAKSVTNAVLVKYEAMKPNPNGEGYGLYIPVKVEGKTDPEPTFVPCKFGVDNRVDVEVIEGVEEGQEVYIKLPMKTQKQREREEQE